LHLNDVYAKAQAQTTVLQPSEILCKYFVLVISSHSVILRQIRSFRDDSHHLKLRVASARVASCLTLQSLGDEGSFTAAARGALQVGAGSSLCLVIHDKKTARKKHVSN